jgi:hypothetical protein
MLFLLPSSTEKIVGIETPKEPQGHWLAAWCFSIGEESVTSTSDLRFCLRNQTSFVHQHSEHIILNFKTWEIIHL